MVRPGRDPWPAAGGAGLDLAHQLEAQLCAKPAATIYTPTGRISSTPSTYCRDCRRTLSGQCRVAWSPSRPDGRDPISAGSWPTKGVPRPVKNDVAAQFRRRSPQAKSRAAAGPSVGAPHALACARRALNSFGMRLGEPRSVAKDAVAATVTPDAVWCRGRMDRTGAPSWLQVDGDSDGQNRHR